MDYAKGWDSEAVREGMEFDSDYQITPELLEHFVAAFADSNPVHSNHDIASRRGFKAPIAFGAVLNGFISHFTGVVFPGSGSVLLSCELLYRLPNFSGDTIRLSARVDSKSESQKVIALRFTFKNVTQGYLSATGKALVKLAE